MNKSRARILSSICNNIAQVFFGAFIGALVLPLDSGKVLVVIFELVSSVIFWILTLLFGEKGKI
jgi:hypothetical protein